MQSFALTAPSRRVLSLSMCGPASRIVGYDISHFILNLEALVGIATEYVENLSFFTSVLIRRRIGQSGAMLIFSHPQSSQKA